MDGAIDERLCDYSEMTETALKKYLPELRCLQKDVLDAARAAVCGMGGRIRAALVMEFCRVCGGEAVTALPIACAAEMIYAGFSLHERILMGAAGTDKLLAGDALVLMSAEIISGAALDGKLPGNSALKIIELLCDKAGIFGLAGGMSLDGSDKLSAEMVLEKYRMRSGALFELCCRAGCIAAGAGISKQVSAGAFGQRVGLAAAIAKDIADNGAYTVSAGEDKARSDVKRLFDEANEALCDFEDNGFLTGLAKALLCKDRGLILPEEIGG